MVRRENEHSNCLPPSVEHIVTTVSLVLWISYAAMMYSRNQLRRSTKWLGKQWLHRNRTRSGIALKAAFSNRLCHTYGNRWIVRSTKDKYSHKASYWFGPLCAMKWGSNRTDNWKHSKGAKLLNLLIIFENGHEKSHYPSREMLHKTIFLIINFSKWNEWMIEKWFLQFIEFNFITLFVY